MQAKKEVGEYLADTLVNKLFCSKIPDACKTGPCILGIDEAGRGPVLGPMVYAIAYYPKRCEGILSKMKFADSKQLTEATREKLFEALQVGGDGFTDVGYAVKIIAPNMISNSMLRRQKYNLNALSHDTAIDLIKNVEASGIEISHVYIDTVGNAITYREKLMKFFPKYHFTVCEKADSKYPIVSAASVCAKVVRDRVVQNWHFAEAGSLYLNAFELGSGYPADPGTKKFLEDSLDPIFGYSTLARFSWSTITKLLEKRGAKCDWNEPEDEKVDPRGLFKKQSFMRNFFKPVVKPSSASTTTGGFISSKSITPKTTADTFFEDRLLSRVPIWGK